MDITGACDLRHKALGRLESAALTEPNSGGVMEVHDMLGGDGDAVAHCRMEVPSL